MILETSLVTSTKVQFAALWQGRAVLSELIFELFH